MNDRADSIADRATRYWGLHQWWDHKAGIVTRCLAFVVDERYVTSPDPNEQLRLGASFGENPFPMEMKRGFLTPWPLPPKYVHNRIVPLGEKREMKASTPPPWVLRAAFTTGRSREVVEPAVLTLPPASTPMPWSVSTPEPP